LDLAAVRADPKPVVGFSDITNLHVALWAATGLASVDGCVGTGRRTDETCRRLLFSTEPITLHAEPSPVTVAGRATGVLVGGCAGECADLPTICAEDSASVIAFEVSATPERLSFSGC
jgi:muramoyltetrapeptide carboxypeptidase